jgi:hypothetical protein
MTEVEIKDLDDDDDVKQHTNWEWMNNIQSVDAENASETEAGSGW